MHTEAFPAWEPEDEAESVDCERGSGAAEAACECERECKAPGPSLSSVTCWDCGTTCACGAIDSGEGAWWWHTEASPAWEPEEGADSVDCEHGSEAAEAVPAEGAGSVDYKCG